MSTFMCNDPHARCECTTEEPIEWPQATPTNKERKRIVVNPSTQINKKRNHSQVIEEISEGKQKRAFKATSGNCFLDVG